MLELATGKYISNFSLSAIAIQRASRIESTKIRVFGNRINSSLFLGMRSSRGSKVRRFGWTATRILILRRRPFIVMTSEGRCILHAFCTYPMTWGGNVAEKAANGTFGSTILTCPICLNCLRKVHPQMVCASSAAINVSRFMKAHSEFFVVIDRKWPFFFKRISGVAYTSR